MTFRQLQYVLAVAAKGSISEAAKALYVSQPSLTSSVQDLEDELGITLFNRTNRGTVVTAEGEEFLSYARQVVDQVDLMEQKYVGKKRGRQDFCVSAQHYSFVVEAFVDVLRDYGGDEYDFRIRETQTYEIIEDVAKLRSQVGVLYLNRENEKVLRRTLQAHELQFTRLFIAKPHVFIGKKNPLAQKETLTLRDLAPYPRLSYEQGDHNSFYFAEEIQSTLQRKKNILVRDRATLFNLLIGLNGYTICSGVISRTLNGPNIVSRPLRVDDYMEIGYITHKRVRLSRLSEQFIRCLRTRSGI